MKFEGFVSGSYTAKSVNIAAEEAINFFAETNETAGAQAQKSYLWTPGLKTFCEFPAATVRGEWNTGTRRFAVADEHLYEVFFDGTFTDLGYVQSDDRPVSMCASQTQLLIVSSGSAYCMDFATNTLTNVTASLAGSPIKGVFGDSYFIVFFVDSNKFQVSDLLNGLVWPGLQVNEVSVFPEEISSIIMNQRQLVVFGQRHIQVYTDTGSDSIYDPIPSGFVETGCVAHFAPALADNTILWINEDERGGRMAWRANGYTPQRISTHAVEIALQSYAAADIAAMATYTYQDGGHTFWSIYIPNTDCSWVYDVGENLWHKRAEWHQDEAVYTQHRSWNHMYAFGKHLVGDWMSGRIYEMSLSYLDENGSMIRRVRQAPTLNNEQQRLFYTEWRVNFDTGLGPQPPLTDGAGDPRPPQAMAQWSDDGGHTWGNEHWRDCGYAGEYGTFVRWQRLGFARRRVFRLAVTDAVAWAITDSSLDITQ